MKRFIIVVYCWRWSQCSAKTELHPIFHFKECMPTTAVESKNWKKKVSKSENQKHWKIIFRFLWLFGKNPCSGPYFGLLFNIMWNVPHEIFLAVQDSSHWLTYSFSLWVVFISPSWGQNCTSLPHHLDFGIFLGSSFASGIDSNFIDLVVWWLRDDTVYAKLWSNISSGGTSSKPSCKCGSKNAQLSRIVGGLESSVGVLFYFSWFQMILSQKHDWPWIVIFSHGTTDGSRMVGEIA